MDVTILVCWGAPADRLRVEVYLPLSDGNRKYSTQNSTQLVVAAITQALDWLIKKAARQQMCKQLQASLDGKAWDLLVPEAFLKAQIVTYT